MATGSINISSNISRSEMMRKSYSPRPVTGLKVSASDKSVHISWNDNADDIIMSDGMIVKWSYTRIVRKIDSYPINENDGVIVVESSVPDQYNITEYIDTNLTNGVTYYYCAFSCSTDGVYCYDMSDSRQKATPVAPITVSLSYQDSYRSSGSIIHPEHRGVSCNCDGYPDFSESDFGKNSTFFQNFFGYRPCLFKHGKVNVYLDPNDYSKDIEGNNVDITTGSDGDVMIEFPRRGIKLNHWTLSKGDSYNERSGVSISMTNKTNDNEFSYNAFNNGSENRDYFYLGAYLAGIPTPVLSSQIRSLSGIQDTFLSYGIDAKYMSSYWEVDEHYDFMGYYQFIYLQVMYMLQYDGWRNSRNKHGAGRGKSFENGYKTGSMDTKGLMYGITKTGNSMKIFGLEDLWGYKYQEITGCHIALDRERRYDDDDVDSHMYVSHGKDDYTRIDNMTIPNPMESYPYAMDVSNDYGFVINSSGNASTGASSTTGYCDKYTVKVNYAAQSIVKSYIGGPDAGIFGFSVYDGELDKDYRSTRLMYL